MGSAPAEKKSRVKEKVPLRKLTCGLYQTVIDDTIARIKSEFVQAGVDEAVLDELRFLWEKNVAKTGVLGDEEEEKASAEAASAEQRQKDGEAGTSAAQLKKEEPDSQPQQQQQQQRPPVVATAVPPPQVTVVHSPQQPVYVSQHIQAMPTQGYYQVAPGGMPPSSSYAPQPMQPMPGSAVYPNTAPAPAPAAPPQGVPGQERSLKRPLDDAAASQGAPPAKQPQSSGNAPATTNAAATTTTIPQRDGPADDIDTAPPSTGPAATSDDALGDLGDDDDDDLDAELNEGDDLADVDDHGEIDEEAITNVVIGQFDKVHRQKAKWRINLKNCVATINGRDYMLKKVTGEMNFS